VNVSRSGRVDLHPSGAAPLGTPRYPRALNATESQRGQATLPYHETPFLESFSVTLGLCLLSVLLSYVG